MIYLGIDDTAFQEMRDLFRETLEDHDMEEGDIAEVIGQIESRKVYIVHV